MSDEMGLTGIAALEAELRDRLEAKQNEINRINTENLLLKYKLRAAQKVIEFYGDPKSWEVNGHPQIDVDTSLIQKDRGTCAMMYLSKTWDKS